MYKKNTSIIIMCAIIALIFTASMAEGNYPRFVSPKEDINILAVINPTASYNFTVVVTDIKTVNVHDNIT